MDNREYWAKGPKYTRWNTEADGLIIGRGDAQFDAESRGYVTEYHPAQVSGPVEACYPAEGGECEELFIRVLAGPSTTHQMNWLYFDDIAEFTDDTDNDDIRALLEAEAEDPWATR